MPRLTIADVEQNNLIRAVFLKNGFVIKEGQTDLKSYVYAAGRELIRRAAIPPVPAEIPVSDGWVKCSDRLPNDHATVLILCENGSQRTAFWVAERSMSTQNRSFEGDTEYDEETDQSYWPSDWFSYEDGADCYMAVLTPVIYWMPLPKPPVTEK
jgi:hypothetical protein